LRGLRWVEIEVGDKWGRKGESWGKVVEKGGKGSKVGD
jgi:hypothetical protein